MKKRILFAAFFAVLFGNILTAQIVFTIQATPSITATAFGYTADVPYTFVFQTGSSYVDTLPYSEFTTTRNYWREEDTPDGQLFLSVAGSGLQGTFERPATDEE
ncbi:MAG: hypothetical protein PSV13_07270 [Lacunisphaera sp.]|nr:hypothetical protein [Lacunisphaera sp.]